jgi:AcrR family transcriptional regulator
MVTSSKLDRRRAASKPKPGDASSREQLLSAASRVFARAGYHGA